MDYEKNDDDTKEKNPKENANILKKILFLYTFPLFSKCLKKELKVEDVYRIIPGYKSKKLGDKLENKWSKVNFTPKDKPLLTLLWRRYWKSYLKLGILQLFVRTTTVLLHPLLLESLLKYFKDSANQSKSNAIRTGILLILLATFTCIYNHNYMQLVTEFGIRVKTAFCSLLYRKVLRLQTNELQEVTTGKIVNLITRDVLIFDKVFIFCNDIWVGLVHTTILSYIMFRRVEWSVFSGLGCLILLLPLQFWLGKKLSSYRLNIGKKIDYRTQSTLEALSAIKIIKMYTWESRFEETISEARRKEIEVMRKIFYVKCLNVILPVLNSKISYYFLIMTYIWTNNTLDAATAYFILSCYGSLRSYIFNTIPMGIINLSELCAALKRFESVLGDNELKDDILSNTTNVTPLVYMNKIAVKIKDKDILSNVSLKLSSGLNTISGPLGSGKSSVVNTILKEYPIYKGVINIQGTISYASEEPWLFPSTIRQNILFGLPYNEKRYQEVVRVCGLSKELAKFLNGDNSFVGDKATNLSNGQKARISLARACYKDSDIYLLDDCLKALDANVSKYVFQECVQTFLKDKLVIFVTNNVHYLKEADHKIVLENGTTPTIERQRKLLDKRITYYIDDELMDNFKKDYVESTNLESTEDTPLLINEKKTDKLYKEENKEGKVSLSVYKKYLRYYGGPVVIIIVIVLFVMFQAVTSYSDKLLSKWVNLEETLSKQNNTNSTIYKENIEKKEQTISLYTLLIFGAAVLAIIKSILHFYFSSLSSQKLHDSMIQSVLSSKMQFFDENKIGNILNRFSKDLTGIDESIPFFMYEIVRVVCSLIGILIVIATVNPNLLIPASIFLLMLSFIRRLYIPLGRSLRRLDAVTRAPMIGHINASLEGLTTIRAYKMDKILQNEYDQHQDLYTSAFYMGQCSIRAFGLFLDLTCVIFQSSLIIYFLVLSGEKAGNVGLVITQAMGLTGLLQWGIRQTAELESQMTSVERVLDYTSNPKENKQGGDLKNWPSDGRIEYSDVTLRYNNVSEEALKNLSFIIQPGNKVGIVGRTGAGKSSIISALFRLYDITGKILIDKENIKNVALNTLRRNLAIIPQDPVLFTGTIRSNIDPLGQCQDSDIWNAIKQMDIKELIQALDNEVKDGGRNFSSGQRQLICLVRALVSKHKIIILDEATANMTPEQADSIQKAIQTNFSNCTILTIAHRIHSVISSDKVMVIEDGQIVEFDSPEALIADPSSRFHQLAQNANEIY